MNPALYTTLVNGGICIAVMVVTYVTKNPLALLGLFFLQQTPVVVPSMLESGDDDEEGPGIGFIR